MTLRANKNGSFTLHHSTKKPVTTMLTYPWKCTVLHLLMTRHFDYCPSASEGDNQRVGSSAPVVSRCFPGGYNVKLYISRGRLAWWLLAFLHSAYPRSWHYYQNDTFIYERMLRRYLSRKKNNDMSDWSSIMQTLLEPWISIIPGGDGYYSWSFVTYSSCIIYKHHENIPQYFFI